MSWVYFLLYALSPVYINWVYMNIGQDVNSTGERLYLFYGNYGVDPTLPIIGGIFFLRDIIQLRWGKFAALRGILAGTVVSYLVSPEVALASGAAFLVAETSDMIVWTGLHKRPALAIALSGVLASLLDTFTFLYIAFGSLDTWETQVVGKIITTLIIAAAYRLFHHDKPRLETDLLRRRG